MIDVHDTKATNVLKTMRDNDYVGENDVERFILNVIANSYRLHRTINCMKQNNGKLCEMCEEVIAEHQKLLWNVETQEDREKRSRKAYYEDKQEMLDYAMEY